MFSQSFFYFYHLYGHQTRWWWIYWWRKWRGWSERFISHRAKCQSLKPHLKSKVPRASIISTVHIYKEIMIKLFFYEKTDGNFGPLRVIGAQTKWVCILKVSSGPFQNSHIQQLCIANLLWANHSSRYLESTIELTHQRSLP